MGDGRMGEERTARAPGGAPGLRTHVGLALVLGALLLAAYGPALRAGFVWDDDVYVTENANLVEPGGLRRIWLEPSSSPQYYPVVHTSFWIERRLWGLAAHGYHLGNVLLHLAVSLLAWRALVRLGVPGAGWAAAIFALHPVHVESVAWVTERKNVLSGVFYLAAFLAWLRFDELPRERRRARLAAWTAGLALFALALGSKSVTASLPVAIVVVMWWRDGRVEARRLLPLAPWLVLGVASGLFTAWLEAAHVGATGEEWSLSPVGRCLVAARALWFYLGKLAWPAELVFIYPRWGVDPGRLLHWLPLLAALGLVVVLFAARRRVGRGPLAAALLFAGTLFPALGFLNVYPHRFSYVADHFQYHASLAPIALFAAALARAATRLPRPLALGLPLAVCAALGVRTWQQAHVYHDRETLWRATLEANPRSFLAQNSLANILLRRGELDEARIRYRLALALRPDDVATANNLAWLLATAPRARFRDGPRAVALAERAARATEYGAPIVLDTLAAAYAEVGRFDEAVRMAERGAQAAALLGQEELAPALHERAAHYRSGRPWRDATAGRERAAQ